MIGPTFNPETYRQDYLTRRQRFAAIVPPSSLVIHDRPSRSVENESRANEEDRHRDAALQAQDEQRDQAIRDALRALEHPVSRIIRETAERHDLTPGAILGPSRKAPIVRARQEAMVAAYNLGRFSLLEIGSRFGGRDHTTVLHACRKFGAAKAKRQP